MKGNKFPALLILLFCCCSGIVSAQNQRSWRHTLERGKLMFRQGDYGNALLGFEDARRQRQAVIQRMEQELINALSLPDVRRMRDSLDLAEQFIRERLYAGAAEALDELYYHFPKESFKNSANAALSALSSLKDYPEAEYWIGEVYLVEGELNLAVSQFQKAYAQRAILENPGFAVELQYKIAAIRRLQQDYNEMERILQSILVTDTLWSDGQHDMAFAKQAMTRTLENNGVSRFLTLYRYSSDESANAHRLLGFYYASSGRYSRAQEHLMFAFLIQNTVIIDEILRGQFDFAFTALDALALEINQKPLLREYAAQSEYYKTAYYLGASLYANGKTQSAKELWAFLAGQERAGEWQSRAQAQLKSPHVERAIEMP